MPITYQGTKEFRADQLEALFLSVDWDSGKYPEKLVSAMRHSQSVYSAWDGDRLVGLISALDDGGMNAYLHYLLVHPDYQGQGIGAHLLELMKTLYEEYINLFLIAVNEKTGFYEKNGLTAGFGKTPMYRAAQK